MKEKDPIGGLHVTKTYTLGLDVIAQQAPAIVNGGTLYLGYDGHGSTRFLVDAGGTIAINDMGTPGNTADDVPQAFAYDAFGSAIGFDALDSFTNILYSGEQFDTTSGLQYLRDRYYDPNTGRFGTLDVYAGNMNDPLSLHKYLYCHGDSVNYTDPSGQFFIPVLFGLVALAGATGIGYGCLHRYGAGLL